jgi:hypothetical protein
LDCTKYRAKVEFTGQKFWARRYFVSTVGRDGETGLQQEPGASGSPNRSTCADPIVPSQKWQSPFKPLLAVPQPYHQLSWWLLTFHFSQLQQFPRLRGDQALGINSGPTSKNGHSPKSTGCLFSRNGFQMAVGWMRAGLLRPGRRLKAPEEGNRGQQRCAMEI